MAELSIASAQTSDMTNIVEDVEIPTRSTDGAGNQEETEYLNSNWTKWFGYYKQIPECKIATDTLSRWTIGDGFIADPETSIILEHINGWGTDTFDDILENLDRTSSISGDAFAEVIRDPDTDTLLNLKPLDPASIKIIADRKGIIKRYEQINKLSKAGETIHKFNVNEIFHLSNKRIADEIHGISDYEAIEKIIVGNNESFVDMKELMHRYVRPKFVFKLDTDDVTKIAEFAAKMDKATNLGENIYVSKGNVDYEIMAIPANATLNPLPWREHVRNYFYQVVGIPQILMGSAAEFSESSAKIAYLSFEQVVKQRQRYIITQLWLQLGLKIDLDFPTSLKNELLTDEAKDKNQGMEFQPGDTTAGVAQ